MFGIDETKMCAPGGSPDSSVEMVDWKADWKFDVLVIDEIDPVQTSSAPTRMVTYWACCATAACAWLFVSATFTPPKTTSLYT